MRICQVAPLVESVPPKAYGGTERVVHWLTEELVRRGHDVTLFASSDSQTSARLAGAHTCSLRTLGTCTDFVAHHVLMLEQVVKNRHDFDVIHSHVESVFFPMIRRLNLPCLSTIHNSIETLGISDVYNEFSDIPLGAISVSHRQRSPNLNWISTIHHGMPRDLFAPSYRPGEYLLFVGRFSPEKRPDLAIEIALRSGNQIRLAAKLDRNSKHDFEFYQSKVEPLLSRDGVEYVGEIDDSKKGALLAGAKALVFPIDWPEPFGLVLIEALAAGTPVIGFRHGSVPEIIEHGRTGFLCDDVDQAVEAVNRLDEINRKECRRQFELRFSVEVMADAYLQVYQDLISGKSATTKFKKSA